ncbi:MAG: sigma-70 family RNA polymerase sigma factor [Clostridiales bacterium]|nr:sigma-70 family RNA polymerase sigma factor [Clostridiales bacterium]
MKILNEEYINELLKSIAKGDDDAIDILYVEIKDHLVYFLFKLGAFHDDIPDIIHNTFVTIIEKSKTKIFFNNCIGWIFRIAKNILYNTNRKNYKINYDDDIVSRLGCTYNERSLGVKYAIDKCDPTSQQVIFLCFYLQLRNYEVAKILDCSIATVKRRKFEIITYFKEIYKNER